MISMVIAVVPIVGAVDGQNSNSNDGINYDGLQIGVTGADVKATENVLQNNKPFGENTPKIIGNNTTNNSTNQSQIMELGASGDQVKKIQQWLTDYGYYSGDIDGEFGASTDKAVRDFQTEAGLLVDGVVGKDTEKAMETWDKQVADVQAASGEDTSTASKETSSSSTSPTYSKKTYATAVRTYSSKGYSGDCWDVSNAMYSQLTSSGQRARIVQYSNRYSSNHRSVEVWNGNGWVDADYSGQAWVGQPTAHSSSAKVIAGS
ncbi:peptidoglycan-binding protein [Methanobacterium subterraneum]|jgi:N-acetylmuramoyl-L-alanine amidase|uniref:Peptidoglycan-binding protein n=2 Tax=Methanobacterium subterraneum TaxID=59277 RepID=A0A2H4VNV6_9EURY|nr:peptidoglycan-binding protein [Methanobacterium subterraneum]